MAASFSSCSGQVPPSPFPGTLLVFRGGGGGGGGILGSPPPPSEFSIICIHSVLLAILNLGTDVEFSIICIHPVLLAILNLGTDVHNVKINANSLVYNHYNVLL